MYLHLFNGRPALDTDLGDDYGSDGPWIGPIEGIQGTFTTHLKVRCGDDIAERFGLDPKFPAIPFVEDCLHHGGTFYSDYEITSERHDS